MKMIIIAAVAGLCLSGGALPQGGSREDEVRQAVQAFYAAFNAHDFTHAARYTTEDWEHINPFGGWSRGRAAVLQELGEVHGTFLKGVTDTPETISVRFAARTVAIVTVISQMSSYTTPDGVVHANERHIRTFVVLKQDGRWLVRLDQNTLIRE